MIDLDNLSPKDLLILTNILALSFSEDKTADQINVIGNFIVGVGCLMLTMAAQQQYLTTLQEANNNNNNNNDNNNNNNSPAENDDTIIG